MGGFHIAMVRKPFGTESACITRTASRLGLMSWIMCSTGFARVAEQQTNRGEEPYLRNRQNVTYGAECEQPIINGRRRGAGACGHTGEVPKFTWMQPVGACVEREKHGSQRRHGMRALHLLQPSLNSQAVHSILHDWGVLSREASRDSIG